MIKFGKTVKRIRGAMHKFGFGQAIEPHDPLVIGQDQFLEQARGIIWDCRGFEHGLPAVPLDFSLAPSSDLNNDFILESLASWPDPFGWRPISSGSPTTNPPWTSSIFFNKRLWQR